MSAARLLVLLLGAAVTGALCWSALRLVGALLAAAVGSLDAAASIPQY